MSLFCVAITQFKIVVTAMLERAVQGAVNTAYEGDLLAPLAAGGKGWLPHHAFTFGVLSMAVLLWEN